VSNVIAADANDVANRLHKYDLSGSTILLTGASGLIGTHILSVLGQMELLGRGPEAIFAISRTNFPMFADPLPKCTKTLEIDLTDKSQRLSLPAVDFVMHSAGYGQPHKFLANPLATIDLNTRVTSELIEHLKPDGRFLFVSTSEIYSGLSGALFLETQVGTTNTDHLRAPYIEGKRCGEAICLAVLGAHSQCVIARVALAYGPGVFSGDDRVLYSFVRQALMSGSIKVADAGLANRTYCYISDTVEVLLKLLFERDATGIFNVGGVSRISIRDLALLVGQLSGSDVFFDESNTGAIGAPSDVQLDLNKVRSLFGIRDYISINEGVERTLTWWRNSL